MAGPIPESSGFGHRGEGRIGRLVLCLALLCAVPFAVSAGDDPAALEYAPAPADNPLKGFVPYAGGSRDFPHSLEFSYLPLRALMTGPDEYDWAPLEKLIGEINSRGCQAVFRVFLEYPNKPVATPRFLIDAGVKVRRWENPNTMHGKAQVDHTPDYEDPRLRKALQSFIKALGARYDGDPRIGFITAGLLGTWGEWHCHPRTEWFASKEVQAEVMDAYEAAFEKTPILLRYPAGEEDWAHAPNHERKLGYHDDSFAWATLDTGRKQDGWFFMAAMKNAGPAAMEKWKTQPIGGEIRPELWKCIWSEGGCGKGQNYDACVAATHASWLMETSTNRKLAPGDRERAIAAARSLGYELQATRLMWRGTELTLQVVNHGVAPFYQPWEVELGVLAPDGEVTPIWRPGWTVDGILPGGKGVIWKTADVPLPVPKDGVKLLLRVPNPLPGGRPLRFANGGQDEDVKGWLSLGKASR